MAKGQKTGGRKAGTPNKINGFLKDAILDALESAHKDGATGYLTEQAKTNPNAFLSLVGKVLPLQLTGEGGGAVDLNFTIQVKK